MRIGKYPHSFMGSMDETTVFFYMSSAKSICKTGSKECVVQTPRCEKKHATIVSQANADGKMLENNSHGMRSREICHQNARASVDGSATNASLGGKYLVKTHQNNARETWL